ncbi:Probable U3 small nucleolar RNA-associated protein 7 [Linum grandiflorum]
MKSPIRLNERLSTSEKPWKKQNLSSSSTQSRKATQLRLRSSFPCDFFPRDFRAFNILTASGKMGVEEENGGSTIILPPTEQELQAELDTRVQKYRRGKSADLEALTDKKLKGQQIVREKLHEKSSKVAANCEKWLVGSSGGNYIEAEGIEKTWRIRQDQIAREVNTKSSSNQYDIVLPDLGPYTVDILPSGRYMALAGRKGHVAIVDLMSMNTIREMQVKETVRDVAFLHNETFFAVAQKKYGLILV